MHFASLIKKTLPVSLLCFLLMSLSTIIAADSDSKSKVDFQFKQSKGKIDIYYGGQKLTSYVFQDAITTRPYFTHVKTLEGTQVTRNHPPLPEDPQDHAELHPGIFLAFGDINGNDYWRLKAKVVHAGFIELPSHNTFTVCNRYLSSGNDSTVCTEICRYELRKQPGGYLIDCKSSFQNKDAEFYFGDQEEMGLGVRMASPLREKGGSGRILSSENISSAKKTWGKKAKWCDYSGKIGDNYVGVMIMASPENVRPTWWHNRNYGLFVANLFGRKAMRQGETSKLIVKQGEEFHLNYGVYIHESPELTADDLRQSYLQFIKNAR